MTTISDMDDANGMVDTRRRNARIAFFCYRTVFGLSLVILSTLSTVFRNPHPEMGTDLLLVNTHEKDEVQTRGLRESDKANQTFQGESRDTAVYFLPPEQLNQKDGFSASWLQTREDFLSMEIDSIRICEDAAFRAYKGERREKMRMTVDWFDWSVEHVSKN
jgi:hypothetical protein